MKTNYFSTKKLSIYIIFGLTTMLLLSCGSTKNTSYYDNDGIYSSTPKNSQNDDVNTNNKYKEYFSSLNQENQEVFTNVENYSTVNDTVNKNATVEANSNNGWGSNHNPTTVIVYENNWGGGWNNWGWNNWYGPNFGWGWNNWGWRQQMNNYAWQHRNRTNTVHINGRRGYNNIQSRVVANNTNRTRVVNTKPRINNSNFVIEEEGVRWYSNDKPRVINTKPRINIK